MTTIAARIEALRAASQNNIEDVYEDLHFLVIIAGFVLADESKGEVAMVPVQLSKINDFSGFLGLVQEVVRLSELTQSQQVSPVLLRDLCWFWERFCRVYLLFWTEGANKQTNEPLQELLSAEQNKSGETLSEVCQCLLTTVYKQFETAILKYSHEEQVCVAAASMLH